MPNRSFLFTPANHERRVGKALAAGADAVILDLEDAVSVDEKPAARDAVRLALTAARTCRAYVRVNAFDTPFCFDDLESVISETLDGVVLPKAESAAQIQAVDWAIEQFERRAGIAAGGIDLLPIVETARGLAEVREICSAAVRVRRVSFGGGDYSRDLGLKWTLREDEMSSARSEIVLASRLAGIEPPIDTVFIHLKEPDAFTASAERGREFGFQGKLLIHPDQIAPTHAAFTPSEDEAAWARKIVLGFDDAEAQGLASIQIDGFFVDYAIVEQARRTLGLYEEIHGSTG